MCCAGIMRMDTRRTAGRAAYMEPKQPFPELSERSRDTNRHYFNSQSRGGHWGLSPRLRLSNNMYSIYECVRVYMCVCNIARLSNACVAEHFLTSVSFSLNVTRVFVFLSYNFFKLQKVCVHHVCVYIYTYIHI